jgi:hypothetical protein
VCRPRRGGLQRRLAPRDQQHGDAGLVECGCDGRANDGVSGIAAGHDSVAAERT